MQLFAPHRVLVSCDVHICAVSIALFSSALHEFQPSSIVDQWCIAMLVELLRAISILYFLTARSSHLFFVILKPTLALSTQIMEHQLLRHLDWCQ